MIVNNVNILHLCVIVNRNVKKEGEIIRTTALSPFGKAIKKRLVDIERSQTWLIEEVSQATGLYFDRSYMFKIQTGQLSTPKIVQAIRDILCLPEENQADPLPK